MAHEEWKDIPGYEGLYQVSNTGFVKSLGNGKSNNPTKKIEKILKFGLSTTGYYYVNLCKDGKVKNKKVHLIVAETFLNHISDGKYKIIIDHIDNNPLNNNLNNLQCISQRENIVKHHKLRKNVGYSMNRGKFRSSIYIKNKAIFLGRFKTEDEALKIYETAKLNLQSFTGCNKSFRELLNEKMK